jgi:hypothetical protein
MMRRFFLLIVFLFTVGLSMVDCGHAGIRQFHRVTGTISYADGSHIPAKSVTILRIERGQRHLVRQLLPSRVPPP